MVHIVYSFDMMTLLCLHAAVVLKMNVFARQSVPAVVDDAGYNYQLLVRNYGSLAPPSRFFA
jgi:hypothetical protein